MAAPQERNPAIFAIRYPHAPAEVQVFPGKRSFEYCHQILRSDSQSPYWDALVKNRTTMLTKAMVVKGGFYANNTLAWSNDPGISHIVWLDGSVVQETKPRACIKTEIFADCPTILIAITSVFGGTVADIITVADYFERSIHHAREDVLLDLWAGAQKQQRLSLSAYAQSRVRS